MAYIIAITVLSLFCLWLLATIFVAVHWVRVKPAVLYAYVIPAILFFMLFTAVISDLVGRMVAGL